MKVRLLFEGNLDADRIREELLFEGITACDCTSSYEFVTENNWRGPCKVILKDLIGEDPNIYIKDLLIHFLNIR